jgi:hypothetical protein
MHDSSLSSHRPSLWKCFGLTLFLSVGYLSPILFSLPVIIGLFPMLVGVCLFFAAIPVVFVKLRKHGLEKGVIAAEVLILVILVLWGLFLNHQVGPSCVETQCDNVNVHRPLAEPAVISLFILHVLSVFAYAISRKRPQLLIPTIEILILGGLLLGIILQWLLAVHFGRWLAYGLALSPVALPAASPLFAITLFVLQVRRRLILHVKALPTLAKSTGFTLVLLGFYVAITALFAKRSTAVFDVFSQTCDYTFSRLPIVIDNSPCGHYLCTVAACGHPRLVRPLRVGIRRGYPILVNRQLATANAFEELLQEKFPRIGRLARKTYDFWGLPVSKYLNARIWADLVYLAMKPAEWFFYGFLLLADPGCPEERLNRMYAPPNPSIHPDDQRLESSPLLNSTSTVLKLSK